jgi:hypothetical protein
MQRVWRERHQDIMRWPWKLFCAKWCRLLRILDQERQEREEMEREREFARLRAAHKEQFGG